MKVSYSDNGGSTWTSYTSTNYGASNVKFRSSELKVIPVNEGGTMFLFVVAGYTFASNNYTALFRYNITGNAFFYANILYPGLNFSYNPRVCTDNSVYASNEYVYLLSSQDSVTTGGNSDKVLLSKHKEVFRWQT